METASSRRFKINGGVFAFAKVLHLGRISARPRWVCRGKNFCRLVLLEISSVTGCVAGSKSVCCCVLRASFVFSFGLPNENAKFEGASLRATIRKIYDFSWRAVGVLRGLPLNPLSWFVLSRTRKNEHKRSADACRRHRVSVRLRKKVKALALCASVGEGVENFNSPQLHRKNAAGTAHKEQSPQCCLIIQ